VFVWGGGVVWRWVWMWVSSVELCGGVVCLFRVEVWCGGVC
jgi:hypothetical protein